MSVRYLFVLRDRKTDMVGPIMEFGHPVDAVRAIPELLGQDSLSLSLLLCSVPVKCEVCVCKAHVLSDCLFIPLLSVSFGDAGQQLGGLVVYYFKLSPPARLPKLALRQLFLETGCIPVGQPPTPRQPSGRRRAAAGGQRAHRC